MAKSIVQPANTKAVARNRMNHELGIVIPSVCDDIPMDSIMHAIKQHEAMVVDEAGEEWSGIFCGAEGRATMEIVHPRFSNFHLHLSWYKREHSGRYEIVVYVS